MVMLTNIESTTRFPSQVVHLASQLRTLVANIAVMTTVSLLVNHSRKTSVAVLDQSVLVRRILLTTLVSRMPALTAMTTMRTEAATITALRAVIEQTHNIQRLKSKEEHDVIYMLCVRANKIVN